jgi:hypothetical protein
MGRLSNNDQEHGNIRQETRPLSFINIIVVYLLVIHGWTSGGFNQPSF